VIGDAEWGRYMEFRGVDEEGEGEEEIKSKL
jgi:hypothetical protein